MITKNDATSTSTEDWVRFDGVRGGLGTLQTATSGNVTIDDSAWRDWTVLLTPGWNMLEKNSSNWINNVGCHFAFCLPVIAFMDNRILIER